MSQRVRASLGLALGIFVILVTTTRAGWAQSTTASMQIEVRDSTNAPIADVVIFVINEANGLTRRGTTSSNGTFAVDRLPTGSYTLTAARDGFRPEVLQNLRLLTSVKAIVPITLAAGQYSETGRRHRGSRRRCGRATARSARSSTRRRCSRCRRASARRWVSRRRRPAWRPPAPGSRLSTQGNTGVNSAGAREAANNFLLDGVDNNDLFLNRLVINPSLDAVQEFALIQNTYDAEYGRSAGAQVNMVVKSGTNDVHGTAYEFFRDSALDARNVLQPADSPKPPQQRHQFGGTIGGPIRSNKAFYFVSVEGINADQADTRLAHVPTAAERAGDFSQQRHHDPRPVHRASRSPAIGIPPDRLSAAGVRAANLYPTPNRADRQRELRLLAAREPRRRAVHGEDGSHGCGTTTR